MYKRSGNSLNPNRIKCTDKTNEQDTISEFNGIRVVDAWLSRFEELFAVRLYIRTGTIEIVVKVFC